MLIVLIRHGESIWNVEGRFTGWTDVDFSTQGYLQAKKAGELLKKHGYNFDIGFTSVLKRAIKTLHIVLEELDHLWIPVEKSWRLNERFYGALQGLNKAETIAKYGEDRVHQWTVYFPSGRNLSYLPSAIINRLSLLRMATACVL